ncbi:hypothetical protein GGR56DRAFT_621953 [Xylariaceae sp. FL0804]|nr:hypothetical protein GGR56DRAFT_621953 [Xylariaceae sp. FL0804]
MLRSPWILLSPLPAPFAWRVWKPYHHDGNPSGTAAVITCVMCPRAGAGLSSPTIRTRRKGGGHLPYCCTPTIYLGTRPRLACPFCLFPTCPGSASTPVH